MADRFCGNCGVAREGAGRFCGSCGESFDAAQATAPDAAPGGAASGAPEPSTGGARRGKTTAVVGGVVVVLAAGAVAGAFILSGGSSGALDAAPDMLEEPQARWTLDIGEQPSSTIDSGRAEIGALNRIDDETVAVTAWDVHEGERRFAIYAVNSDSGQVEWVNEPIETGMGRLSPQGCLDAIDGTLPCIGQPEGDGQAHAVGLGAGEGAPQWTHPIPGEARSASLIPIGHGDVVVESGGSVTRLSAGTGEVVWSTAVDDVRSLTVSEPYVSVGSALLRADTGEVLPWSRTGGPDSGFVVVDGVPVRYRLGSAGSVERLDDNGNVGWSRPGNYSPNWSVRSDGADRVFVTSEDEALLTAVNVDTGEDLWTAGITWTESRVATTGSVMIFEGTGYLRAVDLDSGEQLWNLPTGRTAQQEKLSGSGPYSDRRRVVAGARQLYILDPGERELTAYVLETGEMAWQFTLPEATDRSYPGMDVAGEDYYLVTASTLTAL